MHSVDIGDFSRSPCWGGTVGRHLQLAFAIRLVSPRGLDMHSVDIGDFSRSRCCGGSFGHHRQLALAVRLVAPRGLGMDPVDIVSFRRNRCWGGNVSQYMHLAVAVRLAAPRGLCTGPVDIVGFPRSRSWGGNVGHHLHLPLALCLVDPRDLGVIGRGSHISIASVQFALPEAPSGRQPGSADGRRPSCILLRLEGKAGASSSASDRPRGQRRLFADSANLLAWKTPPLRASPMENTVQPCADAMQLRACRRRRQRQQGWYPERHREQCGREARGTRAAAEAAARPPKLPHPPAQA
mmetsp:Transcript_112255/g.322709  ORF Transcript_112255/g.322709 Transcript_112255/m.322709 type:complete len:296 (-) Transcript_112255:37-924(-)